VLHIGLVAVIAITLVPLISISLLMLRAEDVVGRAMQRLPVSWEQQLGEQALKQLYVEDHVIHSGAAHAQFTMTADKLLQHLGASYEGKILLVEGPRRRAVVLPGGTIVVWSGLLQEMRTQQELAGLLAHEIEHGMMRHSLHAILRDRGMRATLAVLILGAGTLDDAMSEIAANIASVAYSRSQEIDADTAARELLAKAGWQEDGLANLWERLKRQSHEPLPIFSIHPQAWGHVESTKPDGRSPGDISVSPVWQGVLDELQVQQPNSTP
jgi:predicted Zn-dependent protease